MKNILIIGASSGIGLEMAKILAEKEYQLITASRHLSDELKNLNTQHFEWDVTQTIEDKIIIPDTLHGVVYAPGTINLKPFHRLTEEEFLHDYQVNVLGATRVLQFCTRPLKKAKGASVVLFSTVAVKVGMGFHSSIAMAKGAVEGLTKSLAAEWANSKIRVNAIAPSLTDTPLAENLLATDEKRQNSAKRHPIGRVGNAQDVAQLAALLLSDEGSWVTGQILGVDGGMSTLKP